MATLDLTDSELDISFDRGDSLDEPIEFVDANDDPITVWGDATFAAQVRRGADGALAATITIDTSEWTSARRIRLQLAKEITKTLSRNYSWDLEVTSGGLVRTRVGGIFAAKLDTTKATP